MAVGARCGCGIAASLGELYEGKRAREVVRVDCGCEMGQAVEECVGGGVQVLIGNAEDLTVADGAEVLPAALFDDAR